MAKKFKKAVSKPTFTKVCQDCGKRYETPQERSQFCPDCRKRHAVQATMRNRAKVKANLAEMSRLNTPHDDCFNELHLKVRKAVVMMKAGAAVVTALRNWFATVQPPESIKNSEYNQLQTMLNCYALQEKGV